MTNYIGEGLEFLDKRQQNSIYDIMNHEAEGLEYILDDPSSILDEIKFLKGKLTDKQIEEACGFGHLNNPSAEEKKKRIIKNIDAFDPDSKLIKRAMDEWLLDFHRDNDGLMKELDEHMEKFKIYCKKRNKLNIYNHAKKVIDRHLRFGWTFDIFEESLPVKVSKVKKIQSLYRGNNSRLSSKSVGKITDKQKRKDWPKLRKSMLDVGFTEEEIIIFYENNYMVRRKKGAKKKKNKKTKKKLKTRLQL